MTAVVNFGDSRLPDRFWSKVIPEPNSGCWLWFGSCNEKGYGLLGWNGKTGKAHRIAYLALIGDVAPGLELDHRVCQQRCCVNPAHLEAVTHKINMSRSPFFGVRRAQSACRHGHEYTEKNTRIASDGSRVCRECERIRAAESRRAS